MKISIDKFKISPDGKQLCFYGEDPIIQEWLDYHEVKTNTVGKYTNFNLKINGNTHLIDDYFHSPESYYFMDGFSPNINKSLHVGHLSNLIIAQALNKMGVNRFNLYMENNVNGKEDKFREKIQNLTNKYNYKIHQTFNPNEVKFKGNLVAGNEKYEGTQGVIIDGEYIVCIKSDGSTSYFFEDMKMLQKVGEILYVTGKEQSNHFQLLKKYNSNVNHLPIGHVSIDAMKMSSRVGNVIYIDGLQEELKQGLTTEGNKYKIVKNILIGSMLDKNPTSDKKLSMKNLLDLKRSSGLYLSYTCARLHSAGLINAKPYENKHFNSDILNFAWLKSIKTLNPSLLLKHLLKLAKKINKDYENIRIKNNLDGYNHFFPMFIDLVNGMKLLGMSIVMKL